MEPHVLLTFGTTFGRSRSIRVNNPRRDLSDAAVRSTMHGLINSEIINAPLSGRINAIRRASFIETSIEPIDLSL